MSTVCPGCRKPTTFEKSKEEIKGTGHVYNIVRCSICQTAIGVVGFYNTDTQLREQREAIRAIALKIGVPVKLSTD